MLRNVVLRELRLARRARPNTARRDASPHLGSAGRLTLPIGRDKYGRSHRAGGYGLFVAGDLFL